MQRLTIDVHFVVSANIGEGCELTVDYCSVDGLCQNGGTCNAVFNGFKCHCAEGGRPCLFFLLTGFILKTLNVLESSVGVIKP